MGSAALYPWPPAENVCSVSSGSIYRRLRLVARVDAHHSAGVYEHPSYVPLLRRSYACGRAARGGEGALCTSRGSVDAGRRAGRSWKGTHILRAARTAAEGADRCRVRKRWRGTGWDERRPSFSRRRVPAAGAGIGHTCSGRSHVVRSAAREAVVSWSASQAAAYVSRPTGAPTKRPRW